MQSRLQPLTRPLTVLPKGITGLAAPSPNGQPGSAAAAVGCPAMTSSSGRTTGRAGCPVWRPAVRSYRPGAPMLASQAAGARAASGPVAPPVAHAVRQVDAQPQSRRQQAHLGPSDRHAPGRGQRHHRARTRPAGQLPDPGRLRQLLDLAGQLTSRHWTRIGRSGRRYWSKGWRGGGRLPAQDPPRHVRRLGMVQAARHGTQRERPPPAVPACPPRRAIPNQVDRGHPLNLVPTGCSKPSPTGPGWWSARRRALRAARPRAAAPGGHPGAAWDYGQSPAPDAHPAGGPAVPAAARRRVRLSVYRARRVAGRAQGGRQGGGRVVNERSWPACSARSAATTRPSGGRWTRCRWPSRSACATPAIRWAATGSPRPVRRPGRRTRPGGPDPAWSASYPERARRAGDRLPGPAHPVLSKLPSPLLHRAHRRADQGLRRAGSNIPGLGHPVYLAGAEGAADVPDRAPARVARDVTMVSYDGVCCIGVNVDPEAITDLELFEACLHDGFNESSP